MNTLQLAITEFALPCPRSGSIDTYSGYGPLPNVGQDIHSAIQEERLRTVPGYVPERWVSHSFEHDGFKITVGGRMDGYIPGRPACIEEIKSTYSIQDLRSALTSGLDHPYLRQLHTYAFLHWLQTDEVPETRLLLVCSRTRETEILPTVFNPEEYSLWLARRLDELTREQGRFEALHRKRKKQEFHFPFPEPRPGQRELIDTVSEHLKRKSRLLLQAPTGLGKTAGILFPALREAFERGQKLIYLTAKNSQHEVAEDAVKRIQATGTKARVLTVHAKHKMCFKDEPQCNPTHCEYARDYYSKLSAHDLPEQLAKKKTLNARTFKKLGRQFEVCPFELQLEAAPRADVVVCDYNYVFSPHNTIGRLLHNGYGKTQPPNLVIDEAHNLSARAADYFTAALNGREIQRLALEAAELLAPQLREPLERVVNETNRLLTLYSGPAAREVHFAREDFYGCERAAQELLSRYLAEAAELRRADPVLRLCQLVTEFTRTLDVPGLDFLCTWTPGPNGGGLKVTCCDAADWLKRGYAQFHAVVAFSATVKPFEYYAKLLGLEDEGLITAEFTSPFPKHNRKILIIPQISTKLRDRQSNYGKIADTISRITSVRPGNYFAFFPSFDFMNQVADRCQLPSAELIRQSRDMSRAEIAAVLERLRDPDRPAVIFAVQGGVFAEGVDYPGEMLVGAFVVGPALPTFDFERELLRGYFERKHGHGFDYAYTYPAMARVVQSAGRVIRSPEDRGLIVLMDRRFTEESYIKAMPEDWVSGDVRALVSKEILNDVRRFWQEPPTDAEPI